jgi:Zn-dependent metalloprotease
LLAFLTTSSICICANNTKNGEVSEPDSSLLLKNNWNHREIIDKIKSCIATDNDIRIIASKKVAIVQKWGHAEMKDVTRVVTMSLDKKTGIYTAMSNVSSFSLTKNKKERKKIWEEINNESNAIYQKIISCLAAEKDVRIIETKDCDVMEAWLDKEIDDVKRITKLDLDQETGIYRAVSKPKTESKE